MQAAFSVVIDGNDVSSRFAPLVISISVSDKAGASSDTASIELDDTGGKIIMPKEGAEVRIKLGWIADLDGKSQIGTVFVGKVDEVRAKGGRGGRTISISAKGFDTRGKEKQGQRRHFDNSTIENALKKAGDFAGVSITVDPDLAKVVRPYIALDNESLVAFGERLAREVGGTFKIVGKKGVLAKRNGGKSPSGQALTTVTAAWGDNLHDYDISPILGRPVEKETVSRWFDRANATWKKIVSATGTENATTTKTAIFSQADESRATEQAGSDAAESDRKSGEGSVEIEGNINAQPEGLCEVAGCRDGADGTYRIESVTHDYSRSGFVTRLELRQPKGSAGKDTR